MIFVFLFSSFAQSGDKTITIQKKRFYQNGQVLTPAQVNKLLSESPASSAEYKLYKSKMAIASPILIVGGIGTLAGAAISLASALKEAGDVSSGKTSVTQYNGVPIMIAGVAVTLLSLPFAIPANKHLKKSISNYNSASKTTGYEPVQFNLMVNSKGIGVRMRF